MIKNQQQKKVEIKRTKCTIPHCRAPKLDSIRKLNIILFLFYFFYFFGNLSILLIETLKNNKIIEFIMKTIAKVDSRLCFDKDSL